MKRVIVTGGTGFIGRVLIDRLRRDLGPDADVIGIGSKIVDLSDGQAAMNWFRNACAREPVDHIFHLAALYKAGDWPVRHPATQFFANLSINVNVLEAWARHCPGAGLTSVLSYCMYPSHPDPHPEPELWGTEPEDYLFAYAFAKKATLIGQRAYRQEHGLRGASVILPTVYGPGDSFAENSHVVGALIGKIVRAAEGGAREVEVWGDGSQEREFLFVDDAADGILAAARGARSEVLNLGVGRAWSIRDLVALISRVAGYRGEIRYAPGRFVGVRRRVLDVERARTELGWTAPTTLEEGISRTVLWYRDQIKASGCPDPAFPPAPPA